MFGKGYWPPCREYATLRGARGTELARHGVQPTQRVLPLAAANRTYGWRREGDQGHSLRLVFCQRGVAAIARSRSDDMATPRCPLPPAQQKLHGSDVAMSTLDAIQLLNELKCRTAGFRLPSVLLWFYHLCYVVNGVNRNVRNIYKISTLRLHSVIISYNTVSPATPVPSSTVLLVYWELVRIGCCRIIIVEIPTRVNAKGQRGAITFIVTVWNSVTSPHGEASTHHLNYLI